MPSTSALIIAEIQKSSEVSIVISEPYTFKIVYHEEDVVHSGESGDFTCTFNDTTGVHVLSSSGMNDVVFDTVIFSQRNYGSISMESIEFFRNGNLSMALPTKQIQES